MLSWVEHEKGFITSRPGYKPNFSLQLWFPLWMYDGLFVWFDSLRPINNLWVIKGRVFLGWTSTKLGLMFLLKDTTQWHRWCSNPQAFGLEASTLPLRSLCMKVGRVSNSMTTQKTFIYGLVPDACLSRGPLQAQKYFFTLKRTQKLYVFLMHSIYMCICIIQCSNIITLCFEFYIHELCFRWASTPDFNAVKPV